jgi:ankyrin repeat protein
MLEPLSPADAASLIHLCESGRLYEVDAWIRSGKSLVVPASSRRTPLGVALATGFHSLIELLLQHEPRQEPKDHVLREAVDLNRPELIELAVRYGARAAHVPFINVLGTGDRDVVAYFLDRGADPLAGVPFAHAFYTLKAKSLLGAYLDCRRRRPDWHEALQEQADIALRQFSHDGNLKWVSLMLWAGADPRSRGPRLEYIDDPDMVTTAFDEACGAGHLEVLKRLKPDRHVDDLSAMLTSAGFAAHHEVLAYLLDLGADPNAKPTGGSEALDACLRHLGWEDFDRVLGRYGPRYQSPAYKVSTARHAVRLLIERGAIWRPEPRTLGDVRRIFYKIVPDVAVEFVGWLRRDPVNEAPIRELLRPPRMQQHVAACERQLSRMGLTVDGRPRASVSKPAAPSPYVLARYDRQRLYDEVWTEPTQKVALRYGISDVALSKVCRLLDCRNLPAAIGRRRARADRFRVGPN